MSAPSPLALVRPSHLDEHRQLLAANRYSAKTVFGLLDSLLKIDSVLDLGCGIGTWMQAAQAAPGREVMGVEVETFDPQDLLVPASSILNLSLDRPVDLGRRFDLVLCLETAEHLPPEGAPQLVASCVRHSSVILFSAAIPGQGGLSHINEQPPEFWRDLFSQAGYEAVDLLRPLLWRDSGIPVWYRQNMLLFVDRKVHSTLRRLRSEASKTAPPLHYVHPELFAWHAGRSNRQTNPDPGPADGSDATPGLAELQAELIAQREYSGRVLGQAWELIGRLRCQSPVPPTPPADPRLDQAAREISELRSSLSWRITAPLRSLGALLLKLRNG